MTTYYVNLLRSLGHNANAVAAKLYLDGFKGVPTDGSSCPIAQYLQEYTKENKILVGYRDVFIAGIKINLPYPVISFIDFFDKGYYSFLREDD